MPVRPGRGPLLVTQDRLAERRFVEGAGIAVAPWREVRSVAEARAAAEALGLPLRLKLPTGGYDGRGQIRIVDVEELDGAWERLGVGAGAVAARRARARVRDGAVGDRRARRRRGRGLPARPERARRGGPRRRPAWLPRSRTKSPRTPSRSGPALAVAMDLQGTLTVELFLMPDDSLVVNELAPRVHNSGHWTIEGAATSQFEQHIRAICGLGLGSPAAHGPAAMVNLLGTGPRRAARLLGVAEALADPAVHLHLYDKREVFERRKMGHLTALGHHDGPGARDGRARRWRSSTGPTTRRRRRTTDDRGIEGRRPRRRRRRRQPLRLPDARGGGRRPRGARRSRRSSRSSRRTGRRIACSATPRKPPVAGCW